LEIGEFDYCVYYGKSGPLSATVTIKWRVAHVTSLCSYFL